MYLYASNLIDFTDLIDRSNLTDLTSYPNQKDFNELIEFNDINNINIKSKNSAIAKIFEKSLDGMVKRSQEITSYLKFRNCVYKLCLLYISNLIDLTDLIDLTNFTVLTNYTSQKNLIIK